MITDEFVLLFESALVKMSSEGEKSQDSAGPALSDVSDAQVTQEQVKLALQNFYENSVRAKLELDEIIYRLEWTEARSTRRFQNIIQCKLTCLEERLNEQY